MPNSAITGWGLHKPERVMTNADFEKIVDTSDEWIKSRSGIEQRHFVGETETTATMSISSARKAMARAGVTAEDLDLIIVATSSPDYLTPPVSSQVQEGLGAKNIGAFQMTVGCTGFVYALVTADQFIRTGAFKTILVVGTELVSRWLDLEDRTTCVLFGDGSASFVVQATEDECGVKSFTLGSDGSGYEHIIVPSGGVAMPLTHEAVDNKLNVLTMNGREVFKFATGIMVSTFNEILKKAGKTAEDVSLLIPHQANKRIIEYAAQHTGLGMDQVYVNVNRWGNTSAASVPIAFCEAIEQGKINSGDLIALVAFGAGLTWAGALVQMPKQMN